MRILITIVYICLAFAANAQFKNIGDGGQTAPKPNSIEVNVPDHKINTQPSDKIGVLSNVNESRKLNYTKLESAKVVRFDTDGMPSKIIFDKVYDNNSRSNLVSIEKELLTKVNKAANMDFDNADIQEVLVINETQLELHKKYQQYINGVKLYYSDVRLHFKSDTPVLMTGDLYSLDKGFNTSPTVSVLQAEAIAKSAFPNAKEMNEKVKSLLPFVIQSELVVYHLDAKNSQAKLAYVIQYYPDALHQWEIVIDADNGDVIKKFTSSCSLHNHEHSHKCKSENMPPPDGPTTATAVDLLGEGQSLNIYEKSNRFYFIDASRNMFNPNSGSIPNDPVGAIWTLDAFDSSPQRNDFDYDHVTNTSNNWSGREEAVSAHVNAGKAYEYFKDIHGRNSINGSGGNIVSFVNVTDESDNSMGNAFWNGAAMWYGNGDNAFFSLARSLDVAGHELTHGVVQNTANLEYFGESGALNESFADIFGVMIDEGDWQIGEDVVRTSAFPSGALRDMKDPHNGAAFQDYGGGWQPKHVDEQFTGPQDNNGVHINSGIPNHAYYQLATAIGTDKAEKIYYRALTLYMTKSSKFVDQRNAVEQAAQDLYGNTEVGAVQDAFAAVGIGAGGGGNYEQDVNINPGQDYVIFTTDDRQGLYLYDLTNVSQISNSNPISKPSVSDDGSEIVFIASDKMMHYIFIDWATGDVNESILQDDPVWRNVVISKDGVRIAAVFDELGKDIWLYDFSINASNSYELYNPTFTEGVSTGDVLYADALEFDFSGEYVMYDANNRLSGSSADIEYWDVGFLKVWNNDADIWSLGDIQKLFSALPEGVSIGNPTFSKNSPFIVAFDFIDSDNTYQLLSSNIEQGDVGVIYNNSGLSYPSFSKIDHKLIFDAPYSLSSGATGIDIGVIDINADKISSVTGSEVLFRENSRWGVWFSNGERDLLSKVEELQSDDQFEISPTLTSDFVNIRSLTHDIKSIEVFDMTGNRLWSNTVAGRSTQINLSAYTSGMYIITLTSNGRVYSKKVMKL